MDAVGRPRDGAPREARGRVRAGGRYLRRSFGPATQATSGDRELGRLGCVRDGFVHEVFDRQPSRTTYGGVLPVVITGRCDRSRPEPSPPRIGHRTRPLLRTVSTGGSSRTDSADRPRAGCGSRVTG